MAPGSEPAQAPKSAGPSPLDAAQVRALGGARFFAFVAPARGADGCSPPAGALQVASAVAALKKHLAKEAAAKNGLFEEDNMFNLVRPPRRAASRPHCLGKLVGRPPPARAGRCGR